MSDQAAAERDRERVRIADLLKAHAPPDWEKRFRRDDLLDAIIDGEPLQMFVMAADIRESTMLMKEAVRFERFAFIMDKFVTAVRRGIGSPGGRFDKFTGEPLVDYVPHAHDQRLRVSSDRQLVRLHSRPKAGAADQAAVIDSPRVGYRSLLRRTRCMCL